MIVTTLFTLLAAGVLGEGVAWEKDYAAAFAKAKERGVPVLVCFNMDGESASDSTVRIYQDPEFVTRSRDFVCVVASTYMHNPEASPEPCPRFGGITCAEHHKIEIKASDDLVGTDTVISPQHVLVSPENRVFTRRAYYIGKSELLKMMKMAEKALAAQKGAGAEADAKSIADLVKAAGDHNAEKRKPAISELGRMEDLRARDALIDLLGPKTMDDTRVDAIDALATKGNYDALPHVILRLGDSNTSVVRHAIVALERIGLPAAVPPLFKLSKKKLIGLIACEVPRALAVCDPTNKDVQQAVKKACSDKDKLVEQSALVALRSIPSDADTRKILETKLTDSNGSVRGIAAWTIGMTRERSLKDRLAQCLEKETNADVRACIGLALESLALDDKAKPLPALDMILDRFVSGEIPRS